MTHDPAPQIGLSPGSLSAVSALLNQLLADEFLLYARARAFHWNVAGRHFKADHALFEDEYSALDETIDAVAERIRALGIKVQARLADYLALKRFDEVDSIGMTSAAMIAALTAGHEHIIRSLRADIETVAGYGDEGTTDFLTGLMEAHEKRAWMLRAHLEG